MAAKKTTAVAVKEEPKSVALPSYLQGYKGPLGTEGIESKDVSVPRLKIAQAISPEVKDNSVAEGALYINITGEPVWNPGDAPLPAIVVAQGKEYILWRDRKDGGGIMARAKPVREGGVTRYKWDKPNATFETKIDGKTKVAWKTKEYVDQDGLDQFGTEIPGNKDSGPAATAHHNYVVVLPTLNNLVCAVSMSRSQVKKAKDLNANLKQFLAGAPISAKLFSLQSMDDKNASGDLYKNWLVKPVGVVENQSLFAYVDGIKKSFEETGFVVDQSDGGDDEGDKNGRF